MPNLASVQFDEARRDGKSQACASVALPVCARRNERFEDALLLFRWNSRAIVAHFDPDLVIQLTGGQLDPATFRRELDGVARKIHEHLLKSQSVA